MTEKEQAAAILAALNAALSPAAAYEYDKVPGAYGNDGKRPQRYAVVDISRKFEEKRRGSGEESVSGGRVGIRYVAKSTNDARNMRVLVTAALEEQVLESEAGELGPFVFETSEAIVPDDGYQTGSDVFVF